jgi:hypothetical protein
VSSPNRLGRLLQRLRPRPPEPKLCADHSHDVDGWLDEPRPFFATPFITRTAAELGLMSPERRQILAASENSDGWPARWEPLIDFCGGWSGFRKLAGRLQADLQDQGPIEAALVNLEREADLHGFDSFITTDEKERYGNG